MIANFKLSTTKYKKITPYKLGKLNIYSIEEAIYIFYNNWKEFSSDFFEDDFINWVKNEILDNNLVEKLNEIRSYSSFYQKSIDFLTINDFYTAKDIETISLELFNWEKRGQSERLKALGDRFFKENLFEKAIKSYSDALDFESTNSILYNNIGICYIRIKKYDLAFDYLKKAFELNDKNFEILYNLIESCILNFEQEQFFYYLKFVKELDIYFYFLGEFYYFIAEYEKALSQFSKAYLLKRDYKIILKISDIHMKKLNYEKALKTIEFLKEEKFDILLKKSQIYEYIGNYNLAIKCLQKANFYKRDDVDLWVKLANLYRKAYEFSKAEGAILKAYNLQPDDNKVLFETALIKKSQGKFKEYQSILAKIMTNAGEDYRKIHLIEKNKKL